MIVTHRWLSLFEGCLLVALGIHFLSASNLLISGTAGIGMILTQLSPLSFGQLFFILNIPFYGLAWRALGRAFSIRTFCCISMLAVLSELMRWLVHIEIQPIFASVLGGMLIGFGLILLFRHNASLGGLNILAVYLERRFHIHASKTTLVGDLLVLCLALFVLDLTQLGYSLIAFMTLCSVVGRYHQPPEWARTATQH